MNNDLIKRIDDWLPYADEESGILASLLRDCRAEIERLNTVLEVTDENHGRTTVLAHKALKDLDKAQAEIDRLSKPYVPSVDALIAEAVAKEREACAIACEAVGKCTEVEAISNAFASHIRARGQK